jgi:hypothetical protein
MYFFDKTGAEAVVEQLRPITSEVMPQSLLATGYREKIAIKLLISPPVELHLCESLIVGNAVTVALAFGDRPIEVEQKGPQLAIHLAPRKCRRLGASRHASPIQ